MFFSIFSVYLCTIISYNGTSDKKSLNYKKKTTHEISSGQWRETISLECAWWASQSEFRAIWNTSVWDYLQKYRHCFCLYRTSPQNELIFATTSSLIANHGAIYFQIRFDFGELYLSYKAGFHLQPCWLLENNRTDLSVDRTCWSIPFPEKKMISMQTRVKLAQFFAQDYVALFYFFFYAN